MRLLVRAALISIFLILTANAFSQDCGRKPRALHNKWYDHYDMALWHSCRGEWDDAEVRLKKAIQKRDIVVAKKVRTAGILDYIYYFPHRQLGIVNYHQGKYAEAKQNLEKHLSFVRTAEGERWLSQVESVLASSGKIDKTPPVLDFSSLPASNQIVYTKAETLNIEGTINDDTFVKSFLLGKDLIFIKPGKGTPFKSHTLLEPGMNQLKFQAYDSSGNITEETFLVFYDSESPKISIQSPSPFSLTGNRESLLSANLEDNDSIEEIKISMGSFQKIFQPQSKSFQINEALYLDERENQIKISATDRAGNRSELKTSLTFVSQGPNIKITNFPQDGIVYTPSFNLKGKVEDKTGLKTFSIKKEAREIENLTEYDFIIPITMDESVKKITIGAQNLAGIWEKKNLVLIKDPYPPRIQISSPPHVLTTANPTLEIKGHVSDPAGINSISLGDNVLKGENKKDLFFAFTYKLEEGLNQLEVQAEDIFGNKTSITRNITLDSTLPSLAIISPQNKIYLNKNTAEIKGWAYDKNGISQIKLNEESLPIEKGSTKVEFSKEVALKPGVNYITSKAINNLGLENSLSSTVTVDTLSPTIKILSPAPSSISPNPEVEIKIQINDDYGIKKYSFQGQLFYFDSIKTEVVSTFVASLLPGKNTIVIKTWDLAGNSSLESYDIDFITPSPTLEPTATTKPTGVPTSVPTLTPTNTPIPTSTRENTHTPTETPTPVPTWTPTNTPIPTSTRENTHTPTEIPTGVPTNTPSPTKTFTNTPTITPTHSPTSTVTHSSTATPTSTATYSPTATLTSTATLSPTAFPTAKRVKPPVITLWSPLPRRIASKERDIINSVILTSSNLELSGEVEAEGKLKTLKINGELLFGQEIQGKKWNKKLTLAPSVKEIKITGEDFLSQTYEVIVPVLVDNQPPILNWNQDIPKFTKESVQTIKFTVNEDTVLDQVSFNEIEINPSGDNQYSQVLELNPGKNSIKIHAVDGAGNESTLLGETILDMEFPEFKGISIPEKLKAESGLFTFTGKLIEDNPLSLEAKLGVSFQKLGLDSEGNFQGKINLKEGKNLLTLYAIDKAGNRNEWRKEIVIDNKPPQIASLSPDISQTFTTPSINLELELTDESPITEISVNGKKQVFQNTSKVNLTVPLFLKSGEKKVKVFAQDEFGNKGEKEFSIKVNLPEPAIAFLGLLQDKQEISFNEDQFEIRAIISDPISGLEKIRLGGNEIKLAGEKKYQLSQSVDLKKEGSNVFNLEAINLSGLSSFSTVNIIKDTLGPKIISPKDEMVFESGKISKQENIQFELADPSGISYLEIEGKILWNDKNGPTLLKETIPLDLNPDQKNKITLVARDGFGQETRKTLSIHYIKKQQVPEPLTLAILPFLEYKAKSGGKIELEEKRGKDIMDMIWKLYFRENRFKLESRSEIENWVKSSEDYKNWQKPNKPEDWEAMARGIAKDLGVDLLLYGEIFSDQRGDKLTVKSYLIYKPYNEVLTLDAYTDEFLASCEPAAISQNWREDIMNDIQGKIINKWRELFPIVEGFVSQVEKENRVVIQLPKEEVLPSQYGLQFSIQHCTKNPDLYNPGLFLERCSKTHSIVIHDRCEGQFVEAKILVNDDEIKPMDKAVSR